MGVIRMLFVPWLMVHALLVSTLENVGYRVFL